MSSVRFFMNIAALVGIVNIVIFLLLFIQNLWAFKVVLLDSTLTLDNGNPSTTATIVNDGAKMIAIEAGARVRKISPDGVESMEEVSENLILLPGQMIIPPNGEQVITIRWVGSPKIEKEEAFRLLVEFVAVSEDKLNGIVPEQSEGKVNIVYRVAKSFYVSPKEAKANVQLVGIKQNEEQGMIALTLENIGTKHQIVSTLDLRFTTSEETLDVSFNQEILGNLNLLPNSKRNIQLPITDDLKGKRFDNVEIVGFGL